MDETTDKKKKTEAIIMALYNGYDEVQRKAFLAELARWGIKLQQDVDPKNPPAGEHDGSARDALTGGGPPTRERAAAAGMSDVDRRYMERVFGVDVYDPSRTRTASGARAFSHVSKV